MKVYGEKRIAKGNRHYMKQKIRIKLHYPFATCYFCVGLTITLFLLCNGIILNNLFEQEFRSSKMLHSLIQTIYLFSAIHCLLIASYWINIRRREIAIRKAFGWENSKILLYIIQAIVKITIGAFILFGCMEVLFIQFGMGALLKQLNLTGILEHGLKETDIVKIAFIFFVTIIIAVIGPIIKIMKEKPTKYMS